jgi:5-methylcytosine-specific restriction protein A
VLPRKPGEKTREARRKAREQRYNQAGRPRRHKIYWSSSWQAVRRQYREEHPLCEACLRDGVVKPADLVHHKVEISEGGDPFDVENLESLCTSCHNRVHGEGRGV